MAGKDKKINRVLYGEENDGDSILRTASFVRIFLILSFAVTAAILVSLLFDGEVSNLSVALWLLATVLGVVFALRVGKALEELGRLVEENAKLKGAVLYLCQTHNIQLRDFEETPAQDIPGTEEDGFESMRIEEDGVHFRRAEGPTVQCPFCEHEQPVGTAACENCGQPFFFEE